MDFALNFVLCAWWLFVNFFTLNYHSDQNKDTQLHFLADHFPLLAPFLCTKALESQGASYLQTAL